MHDTLQEIRKCLVELDRKCVIENVRKALDSGISAIDIVISAMSKAMEEVGRLYESGDYFIAELLEAASIFKDTMGILKPRLVEESGGTGGKHRGKVVIGTVKGDVHDIGKSLVAIMLEAAGYEVIDLGVDVPADKFVEAYYKYKPNVIALSALLTTTATYMKVILDELSKNNIRNSVKVIVGGAAVSERFAREIGADGWALNAIEAVKVINKLLNNA